MITQHNYTESLNQSKKDAESEHWQIIYRQAFPDFQSMSKPVVELDRQYKGIDRVITLEGGKQIFVDEKYRYPDRFGRRWTDVLIEVWSDYERRTHGWISKPLWCDFVAYAFADSKVCYMLPYQQLKRAWLQNEHAWKQRYGRSDHPERLQTTTTTNNKNGHVYTTAFICIPIAVVLQAMNGAVWISWQTDDGLPW